MDDEGNVPEAPHQNAERNRPKNVLVVDDDPGVLNLLETVLKRAYYEPFFSGDGKGALSILEAQPIDIVLLDVKLPDTNGLDLLVAIKEKYPGCQIIVITGYGSEEIAILALRKGALDYIEKPVNEDELVAALGRAHEKLVQARVVVDKSTILVVDDDVEVVGRLKRFLEKEGFSVFSSTSPQDALEVVANHQIDVIVTDFQMNGMDGLDLLQKAKALYSDIEGIIVTGHTTGQVLVKALRVGAFDYIGKPVDLDALLFAITKAVERIHLNRNRLYRSREMRITTEIITKMNEELERRIEERSKELNKTQTQLFQTSKLATLGEMAAGLAHEINQPLNGIALINTNIRKLMERDRLSGDELKRSLQEVDGLVRRMKRIIEHIRTFARQEVLKFEAVEIPKTLDSALSLMGEQLRLHEIEVEMQVEDGLPRIQGEPYQLEQVWINLLSNARDALDEKGKQVTEGKIPLNGYKKSMKITVGHEKKSNRVAVCFADNGIGVDEDQKKKVFEPFFTTKEVGKSTGLGLSISYGIIENHKGVIEFDSVKGEGVTVKVFLPVGGNDV